MILNQITIWRILGIFIWIGSIDCQEALPEALGYAEPEALGYAEPEALGYAEPEALGYAEPEALGYAEPEALGYAEPEALGFAEPESGHYMLQKRSLPNEELEELSLSDPEVEPQAEDWKRKKRETDYDSNFSDVETEKTKHYLGDGHDHDLDDFDDENNSNEREKRTVFTGLALYQLGKSLEKKAESNGGTRGIPYELIQDDENLGYVRGFIVPRPKRSLGSKSSQKLLNWLLDKKSEKEENFRKYFVKGRYYYKPDSEFGSQDLEYLNYYSTATSSPPIEYQETLIHGCDHNEQLPPPRPPPVETEQENNPDGSYQVPLPAPPVVDDGDDIEESYEVPPPPEVDDELEESYEVPPPNPPTVDEELEEAYEVPPPIPPTVDDDLEDSYEVPPPPSSYEIPLNGDHQTPILVRPLTAQ